MITVKNTTVTLDMTIVEAIELQEQLARSIKGALQNRPSTNSIATGITLGDEKPKNYPGLMHFRVQGLGLA